MPSSPKEIKGLGPGVGGRGSGVGGRGSGVGGRGSGVGGRGSGVGGQGSGAQYSNFGNQSGPTALPGNLSRRELVERYESKTGREVRNPVFYYCFGLFKIAVILQQIYARYVRGHTRDPRFAQFDDVVAMMGRRAVRALDSGSV